MKKFEEYVALADSISQSKGTRKDILEAQDKIFQMKLEGMPTADWIKQTASPDGHNAVMGGARMLSASEPKWNVPFASPDSKLTADEVEKFCEHIWTGAGLISRKPVHFTMALSALLYGEIHLRPKLVSDMIALASDTRKIRLEQQVLQRTPIVFDVVNPKLCYVIKDDLGMVVVHLTKRKISVGEVRGLSKEASEQTVGKLLTDEVTIMEMYDEEYHAVWLDGQGTPIIFTPLPNGIIPVVYADIEGSDLFAGDPNTDTTMPFLYAVDKSGLWNRQNLMLTVFYSMFFAMGASPSFVASVDPSVDLTPDYSTPGGIMRLGTNGNMTQLMKSVFTQDFMQGLQIAEQKIQESTIYKTSLGESPGSGAPYSLAALLSQNGRQSLIPYERMCEHACSMGMTTGLLMLKNAKGGKITWKKAGEEQSFTVADIPDDIAIEAKLKIDLPVDERSNAQVAVQLTSGPSPLTTKEYAREKYLDVGQSKLMDLAIFREKYEEAMAQIELQKKLQSSMPQPGSMPPGSEGMPTQGMPPQGMPNPDMMTQSIEPGLPMTEPMAPEQTGGMNPPQNGNGFAG